MHTRSENGTRLAKRLLMTNLIANAVGGPVTAAYGGFMMDFSDLSLGRFIVVVIIVMAVNLALLSIPANLYLGARLHRERALLSSDTPASLRIRAFMFIYRLPLIQAGLIFARMFLSAAAVVLALGPVFFSGLHALAVLCFGIYASYVIAVINYYYLQQAASALCEDVVADLPSDDELIRSRSGGRGARPLSGTRAIVPTFITSLGILFLVLGLQTQSGGANFLSGRVAAALGLNVLTMIPLNLIIERFHSKRLAMISKGLEDIVDRGDIMRNMATDLGDDYAITAHRINRSFDLFRQVLKGLGSASSKISNAVMGFSSQIRETVAATTQQASAVKEMVSSMESSNQISMQIEGKVEELAGQAQESLGLVDDGFGKIQDTIRKMDEIKDANVQTLNEIGDLTEELSSIGEIIEIISNIANQTRIIAFNAELEASSAGAAGTSFRIVAEEIRRLANGTVDSLVGIRGRIAQIQQGSQRLLETSEDGTAKIQEGMQLSGDLNNIFMSIRESADGTSNSARAIRQVLAEQNQAFDQIFSTIKQISEGAEQVMAGTRMAGGEVGRLQGLMDELKTTLAHFRFDTALASDATKGISVGNGTSTTGGQL